jgi:hypothetical protein
MSRVPDIAGLRIYCLPGCRRCVIGADPAEGNPSSTDSGAVALDADTGEQLMSLQGKIEPSIYAVHLDKLALWYNRATLNVERNNHGHAVLLWLEENSNAYVMAGPDDRKGWLSNAKGKALMYDLCTNAIRDRRVTIHDQTCFNQLASIVGGTLKPQEWVAPTKLVQPQATPVAQLKAAARAGVFGIGQSGRRGPFG